MSHTKLAAYGCADRTCTLNSTEFGTNYTINVGLSLDSVPTFTSLKEIDVSTTTEHAKRPEVSFTGVPCMNQKQLESCLVEVWFQIYRGGEYFSDSEDSDDAEGRKSQGCHLSESSCDDSEWEAMSKKNEERTQEAKRILQSLVPSGSTLPYSAYLSKRASSAERDWRATARPPAAKCRREQSLPPDGGREAADSLPPFCGYVR
jgi:hypothetical protein